MITKWNRVGLPVAVLVMTTAACGGEAGEAGLAYEGISESDGGAPSSLSSPAPSPSAEGTSGLTTDVNALLAARPGVSWEKRGLPHAADRIAGCKDGTLYALNYNKGLYHNAAGGIDSGWVHLGTATGAADITCNDKLWVFGTDRTLYRNDGSPTSISWTYVGRPTGARQVTAGYVASGGSGVYALNDDNSLWRSPTGADGSWTRIGAPMQAARVGGSMGGIYALNANRTLFRGTGSDNAWVYLDNPFAARTISDDGSVKSGALWALNDNQELYRGVVNAGGEGEVCRPYCMGSLAQQILCDRCNEGLTCGRVGKCVAAGGANQPCNESDIVGGGTTPRCDMASLTCVTLERGPTCIEGAGTKGKTCRNASDSNGPCNTGLTCDPSNHVCVTAPRPFDLWRGTWEMFWFSTMAYWENQNNNLIPKQNCADKFGIQVLEYDQDTEVETLYARDATRVIVAFAGTDSVRDGFWDLFSVKVDFHGARVHDGFLIYADRVWPKVKNAVAAQLGQSRTREIWLAGHSLGAAVAQLIAVKLQEEYKNDPLGVPTIRVITFGSPMIGGKDWSDLYEGYPGLREASHRWVNLADKISYYPDNFSFRDWEHVGLRHHLYYSVTQNCDLRGFSTYGEYLEHYLTEPICSITSGVKAHLNTGEITLRNIDQRWGDHSLDSAYRPSLRLASPSSYASLANISGSK
jgi:Lipase (class 3)